MKPALAIIALLLSAAVATSACDGSAPARTIAAAPAAVPLVQKAVVVRAYPHDPTAFTQGLVWRDGTLFESTGLEGRSTIRQVRLEDGRILRQIELPGNLFGEGIVDWKDQIVSITWQSGIGFRWRLSDFGKLGEFRYPGEGWGLTHDGSEIIMSDGTPALRFLDPATLAETRQLMVTDEGAPVRFLNELEYVKGEIFANVWMSDVIVRIDPKTGHVLGRIDLAGLGGPGRGEDDVLNGIAYDKKGDRLFVTGKNWPKLYHIKLARP